MRKRQKNNTRTRVARALGALLRTNHVAVVNIEPRSWQGMVNWKNCKRIPPGRQLADAVCDYAHNWTIYLSGFCIDQNGLRYFKSAEIAPQGIYLADHLSEVIEEHYRALLDTCNPKHLVGSGWIAIPNDISLDEEQAAKVFEAVGAWNQQAAA
jgi:hypothetical protein